MKKRMKNKRGRLLIKKKNSSWIILNNDRFLLTILLLAIVMVGLFVSFNRPASQDFSGTGELAAGSLVGPTSEDVNRAITDFFASIQPWLIPSGMEGVLGLIVGIVSLAIIFSIMFDIITLVSPFSSWVNWVIGIGLGIVMIISKWNVTFAGWIVGFGAVIFGWAGTLALGLTIVLAIAAMIFIFFGGIYLQRWLIAVRARRRGLEITKTAMDSATDIRGLRKLAASAMKRTP